MASRHPELHAVIAGSPSSVAWPGVNKHSIDPWASWSVDGRPLAVLPYGPLRPSLLLGHPRLPTIGKTHAVAPPEDHELIVDDPLTDRQRQLVLASLVGFGVLYLAAGIALGTTPKASDTGAAVAAWFRHNGGHVRLWLWLVTLGLPLFATFAALIRRVLPPVYRDVFFFGAIAFAVETAAEGWIWAGLALHARQLEPATARTVLDVASFWGPVLISATVMTLPPIALLALGGRAGLPRWLGIVTLVALVEQLAETVTLFGSHGFIAPGGPMNLLLGAGLTALAWLSLAVAVSRSTNLGTAPTGERPIGASS